MLRGSHFWGAILTMALHRRLKVAGGLKTPKR